MRDRGTTTAVALPRAPSAEELARRGSAEPGVALFTDHLRDIVRRLSEERDVTSTDEIIDALVPGLLR